MTDSTILVVESVPSVVPTVVAFALLVSGVVGSAYPKVPGALFSLLGVLVYWWGTGYSEPGTLTVAVLVSVALLVVAGRATSRVVTARIGGASMVTTTLAGAVGLGLFPFLGTTGLLLGTVLTVFIVEYLRNRNARRSLIAALAVLFGTFASRLLQVVLTAFILLAMVFVAL